MQSKYLCLATFVLENNYVKCEGLDGVFLQKVGTAIGIFCDLCYDLYDLVGNTQGHCQ